GNFLTATCTSSTGRAGSIRRMPQLAALPHRDDATFDGRRCAVRATMRTTRSVAQSVIAFGLPAPPPLVRGRPRNVHLLGNHRHWLTSLDPSNQFSASPQRQPSITVHKGLPDQMCVFSSCTPNSRRPPSQVDPVDNV